MIVEIALSSCEISGIYICSDRNLPESEHADDVVLLSYDSNNLQVFLDRLKDSLGKFGMRFAP